MAKKTTTKNAKSTTKTAKPEPKTSAKKAATLAKAEAKQKESAKQEAPAITSLPVQNIAPTTEPEKAAKAEPRPRDPRLPAPGTVLQKKDRQGNVRCECTVEADSILYKGTTFRSLSAAAMAASKDLGLGNGAANGYLFWGLVKQAPREKDPVGALEYAWERYRARAASATAGELDAETKQRVLATLNKHSSELASLA